MKTYIEKQIESAVQGVGDLKDMNPGFSIAYAILRLAEAQQETAAALHLLGTGNAATEMGAIEALSVSIKDGLSEIANVAARRD